MCVMVHVFILSFSLLLIHDWRCHDCRWFLFIWLNLSFLFIFPFLLNDNNPLDCLLSRALLIITLFRFLYWLYLFLRWLFVAIYLSLFLAELDNFIQITTIANKVHYKCKSYLISCESASCSMTITFGSISI